MFFRILRLSILAAFVASVCSGCEIFVLGIALLPGDKWGMRAKLEPIGNAHATGEIRLEVVDAPKSSNIWKYRMQVNLSQLEPRKAYQLGFRYNGACHNLSNSMPVPTAQLPPGTLIPLADPSEFLPVPPPIVSSKNGTIDETVVIQAHTHLDYVAVVAEVDSKTGELPDHWIACGPLVGFKIREGLSPGGHF